MKRVSKVPEPFHIVCLVLNIILPGVGTLVAIFAQEKKKFVVDKVIIGIVQLITAPFIVGWLFSIFWGWLIYQRSHGVLKKLPSI